MDWLTQGMLIIHIIAGGISLITGLAAIISQKGGRLHRRSGLFYYYGMWTVFITALVLSVQTSNVFLFMIGFFSFYFVWIGRKMLQLKRYERSLKARKQIRWVSRGVLVVCVGLIVYGVFQLLWLGKWFGIVALLFAYAGGTFAMRMIYLTKNQPEDDQFWLYAHIIGMGAGYIATVTAFLVVNLTMVPVIFRWLLPALIGSFMIQRVISSMKKENEEALNS